MSALLGAAQLCSFVLRKSQLELNVGAVRDGKKGKGSCGAVDDRVRTCAQWLIEVVYLQGGLLSLFATSSLREAPSFVETDTLCGALRTARGCHCAARIS